MSRVIKFLRTSSLGFSLIILVVAFLAIPHVQANTYNSANSYINSQSISNSGNNSVSSGDNSDTNGNTVQSGDATSNTTITTLQNTNIIKTGCNCTPTPTGAPTVAPTATPTPQQNSGGSNNNSGGSSSSSSSGSSSAASPAQEVLGLSNTAGDDSSTYFSYLFGFVCLAVAGKLTKPFKKSA